jgi:hypothetical protein
MKQLLTIFLLSISLTAISQRKPARTPVPSPSTDSVKVMHMDLTEEQMKNLFYLVQTGKANIFDSEMPAREAKGAYQIGDSLARVISKQSMAWHPAAQPPVPKKDSTSKK